MNNSIKKNLLIAAAFACLAASAPGARAAIGPDWIQGNLSDVNATPVGLLVRMDTGVPTNCNGVSAYGWMLIPEANKTMIALAMAKWIANQRGLDIYASLVNGQCVVTQVDSY